ncbi:MAG: phosphodiester glycosidase family protein [Deltaproteobacteria bacterium]|nr:phosphodiester glycosidase family protein [Deltaproteobacteria bacterium]
MTKWIGRIFILMVLLAGAVVFFLVSFFPDQVYRTAMSWVSTYRASIEGGLKVEDAGFWVPIRPGLERRVVKISRAGKHKMELYALRAQPDKFSLRVIAQEPEAVASTPIGAVAEATGAVALINGSFFTPDLGILGLCIAGSETITPLAKFSDLEGIFFVRDGKPGLVHRDQFREHDVTDALQSGPWLVRDGKPVEKFKNNDRVTRRSAVGIDHKGNAVFVATDTVFSGLTLDHFAALMAMPAMSGGFQCIDALNLDGGTSTQLMLSTTTDHHWIRGFVNVPVFIGLFHAD